MVRQNNLKAIRNERKLSQQAVSDKANIYIRLYQYYEAGEREPGVYTALKIAEALNTTVEELFPIEGE